MAMDIRMLGNDYFEERMELSQFAFQYRRSEEELNKQRERENDIPAVRWGAFVEGELAAQLIVLDLHVYIGGKPFPMGGVAGVSTWPEYRRQGLVAELLRHSLKEMKEAGQTVSMLHPFSFSFYRKFGYETYIEYKKYTIAADQLPPRKACAGRIKRIEGDFALLNRIYDAYATQYNGTLARTENWWKYRVVRSKPELSVVYYNESGEPVGYMLYAVKDKKLGIEELVCLNEEAYEALWSFVAQHDSMIDSVTIIVPVDDLLPYRLPNPRITQEIIPYFMARIVDAQSFVRDYAFERTGEETTLAIQISDKDAPWNDGSYMLTIGADGHAALAALDETPSESLQTDIGSFTAMLFGYRRAEELRRIGRLTGGADTTVAALDARLPKRTTYLADFF